MAMTHAAGRVPSGAAGGATLFAGAGWPLVVFMWAIYSVATALNAFSGVIDQLSTDDAMRLVEVRDLLAGQGWHDLVQHRLNPPDGVLMHWSRVIDLPIAVMLRGFGLVFDQDLATRLTLTVWPALLFLPALFAVASASTTLGGPAAGVIGAFMLVMSPAVAQRYAPAAIDHHGAQVALALILLACALKLDRSVKAGVGAGMAAAVMMAIGIETAPHVAVAAGFVAIRWAVVGDEAMARGAGAFGLSFALSTAVAALTTLSPEAWLAPVCDAFGLAHIVVAALGGIGLFLATRIGGASVATRVASLAQVGAAIGAGVLLTAPDCLASPFAGLPERLKTGWLDHVQEAKTLVDTIILSPTSGLAISLPLLVLVAIAAWAFASAPRDQRWRIGTAVVMCAVGLGVTLWQIRGSSLAFALGAPLLPLAAIAIGRTGVGPVRTALAVIGLCPAALALAGLGAAGAAGLPSIETELASSRICRAKDYEGLARLPRGLALNTIDTGPFILAHSPMSAVAGPYHRNVDGIVAALDAFEGSEETARAIAVSRGAAYVVLCAPDATVLPEAAASPDGFAAALLAGRPPSWLSQVDLGPDTRLKAYRVLAGR